MTAPGTAVSDQKEVYEYDLIGNVVNQKTYVFVEGHFILQSEYEFSDYDSKQSVDDLFGGPNALNLATKITRHNPGKTILKNSTGVIGKIEEYDYKYNELNLTIKRTTSVTFHLTGSTGSYDTYYFYK